MRDRTDKMTYRESHGGCGTRLYCIWAHMKSRCLDRDSDCYNHYGGRGITVCDEWKDSFSAFRSWAIDNGYKNGLTIERIDVNGNYQPNNCRWIPQSEQSKNTRRTIMLSYNGDTLCLKDMANKYGLNQATLRNRLNRGLTIQQAITMKPYQIGKNQRLITFRGVTLPLSKMARLYGLTPPTLCHRLKIGWSVEKALTEKLRR